jgi:hypothetical protein
MKTILASLFLVLLNTLIFAQKSKNKKEPLPLTATQNVEIKIPMTAEHWNFQENNVEFVNFKGVQSMKFLSDNPVVLKDIIFENGTIEYDVQGGKDAFSSIYFHQKDKNESECFYFRNLGSDNPAAIDAFQYTPVIRGINLWDLMPHFQGAANLKLNDWNHVKLVISGRQMLIYINDLTKPIMEIPRLEGSFSTGELAFDGGNSYLANLTIKPNQTEGLSPKEGADPTYSDFRYLRNWQVNKPMVLPEGQELYSKGLSKLDSTWSNIESERRGLINLTRRFGEITDRLPYQLERKVVLLKVKLNSKTAQKKLLRLGFSDEVWVFLNKKTVFVDKNIYSQNMRKVPDGRISIENSAFEIALNQGENELLIGVATNFYGWGIVARLEDMEGVLIVK